MVLRILLRDIGFLCRETLHTSPPVSTVQAQGVDNTTLIIEARFMLKAVQEPTLTRVT